MSRWLNPAIEPAAIGAAVAAVYAAAAMLYRAFVAHDGVLDWDVLAAAATLVWQLWTRLKVTPTADPKSAAGTPLVPRPMVRGDVEW